MHNLSRFIYIQIYINTDIIYLYNELFFDIRIPATMAVALLPKPLPNGTGFTTWTCCACVCVRCDVKQNSGKHKIVEIKNFDLLFFAILF